MALHSPYAFLWGKKRVNRLRSLPRLCGSTGYIYLALVNLLRMSRKPISSSGCSRFPLHNCWSWGYSDCVLEMSGMHCLFAGRRLKIRPQSLSPWGCTTLQKVAYMRYKLCSWYMMALNHYCRLQAEAPHVSHGARPTVPAFSLWRHTHFSKAQDHLKQLEQKPFY